LHVTREEYNRFLKVLGGIADQLCEIQQQQHQQQLEQLELHHQRLGQHLQQPSLKEKRSSKIPYAINTSSTAADCYPQYHNQAAYPPHPHQKTIHQNRSPISPATATTTTLPPAPSSNTAITASSPSFSQSNEYTQHYPYSASFETASGVTMIQKAPITPVSPNEEYQPYQHHHHYQHYQQQQQQQEQQQHYTHMLHKSSVASASSGVSVANNGEWDLSMRPRRYSSLGLGHAPYQHQQPLQLQQQQLNHHLVPSSVTQGVYTVVNGY
jgi:hypothetical protein